MMFWYIEALEEEDWEPQSYTSNTLSTSCIVFHLSNAYVFLLCLHFLKSIFLKSPCIGPTTQ